MAKMILKGTRLYAREYVDAATLHRLARWARKLESVIINGRELTADELEHLARQSERSGEPVYFPEVPDSQS
jgi:hypothetical protein